MNIETEVSNDLWVAVRRSYESGAWSNSILDAIYLLSDHIRNKADLQSDGTALAGQAFGGKSPRLKLSRLQTESEINVQAGVEQLVRGLFQAVRNPRSHEKIDDSQQNADSIIMFVNYLLGVVGQAKSVFSIDDVIARLQDENFVPNQRYAELILNGIPKHKRLGALIAAFDERNTADCSKVRVFFQVAISSLDSEEKQHFFDVVSNHLRRSDDDRELRSVLQLLTPNQWILIGEVERMRSENRLIRSMRSGRYSSPGDRCLAGGLATWATSYLARFTLKDEVISAIYALLRGDEENQEYAFKYFFHYLDDLADSPPSYLLLHFRQRLKAGDRRYYDAIEMMVEWSDSAWKPQLEKALQEFQEAQEVAPASSERASVGESE